MKVYASGQALFRLRRAADHRALLTTRLALHPASIGGTGVYLRQVSG